MKENACPSGATRVTSLEDCQDAAIMHDATYGTSSSWTNYPGGCFKFNGNNVNKGKYYHNKNATGGVDRTYKSQAVCIGSTVPAPTKIPTPKPTKAPTPVPTRTPTVKPTDSSTQSTKIYGYYSD